MADALPLNDLHHVLTTTRAIRSRLDFDRPVAIDTIGECLQLALQAPTGGNAQDWRWIVVTNPAVRARIGEIYWRAYNEHVLAPLNGEAGAFDPRVNGRLGGIGADGARDAMVQRVLDGADHLARNIGRAPVLVLPCATRPRPDRVPGAGTMSAVYGSVYPAIWQFNLALRARGLGTVITTLHLHAADEMAELLGIPDHALQIALLPVAYTLGMDFRPAKRGPLADIAYLDGWGGALPYEDRAIETLGGPR